MKKRFLILISMLSILCTLLSLVGCIAEDTPISDEPEQHDTNTPTLNPFPTSAENVTTDDDDKNISRRRYSLAEDLKYFKLIGRTQILDEGVSCDFTASGIEFEGIMSGDVVLLLSCDRSTYFTVYIDGKRVEERFCADSFNPFITVASFEGEELHNVRILKQTEPQWSLSILNEIFITGYLNDAPANKELYLEFIGDSITCGYGNLAQSDTPNAGTALYEDGTQAYAFMTAESLDADYSIVGCSGIGIDKSWTDFNESDFYPKASFYRDRDGADYSFARIPDLVVINLGTNDKSRGSTEAEFKTGVRALIEYVRSSYGSEIPIVWAHNMMGSCRFEWTESVLEDMGGEDSGIYFVKLAQNNAGGNSHPELSAHKIAAEELTRFIIDKNILVSD